MAVLNIDIDPTTEIISERTARKKTFDNGNGTLTSVISTGDLHYRTATGWDEIDLTLQLEQSAKDYQYQEIIRENIVTVGFRQDGYIQKFMGVRGYANEQFEVTPYQFLIDGQPLQFPESWEAITKTGPNSIQHTIDENFVLNTTISGSWIKIALIVRKRISDFRLKFRLDLKSYQIQNEYELVDGRKVYIEGDGFTFQGQLPEDTLRLNKPHMWTDRSASYGISHLLYEEDGVVYYEKICSADGQDWLNIESPTYYIDASVVYSSTADGYVTNSSTSSWAAVHDAATGTAAASADASAQGIYVYSDSGSCCSSSWNCTRSFFYFNTSGMANVTAAVLSLYPVTSNTYVTVQFGTQAATLSTTDYAAFTGSYLSTSGTGYDQLVSATLANITFNATGKSGINSSGTTKLCVRDYGDYNNYDPGSSANRYATLTYADSASNKPYLTITYPIGFQAPKQTVNLSLKAITPRGDVTWTPMVWSIGPDGSGVVPIGVAQLTPTIIRRTDVAQAKQTVGVALLRPTVVGNANKTFTARTVPVRPVEPWVLGPSIGIQAYPGTITRLLNTNIAVKSPGVIGPSIGIDSVPRAYAARNVANVQAITPDRIFDWNFTLGSKQNVGIGLKRPTVKISYTVGVQTVTANLRQARWGHRISVQKLLLTIASQSPAWIGFVQGLNSIGISALDPDVYVEGGADDKTVYPDPQVISVSTQNPTIAVHVTLSLDAQSLSATLNDSIISGSSIVAANEQILSFQTQQPTVSGNCVVTVDKQLITVTVLQPSVKTTGDLVYPADKQIVNLSVQEPSVKGDSNFATRAQSVLVLVQQPTVAGSALLIASTQGVTVQPLQPSISGNCVVTVDKQLITVTVLQPSVKTTGDLVYPADKQIVNLSVQEPSVKGDSNFAAHKQIIAIQSLQPTVAGSALFTASTQTINVQPLQPLVSGNCFVVLDRQTIGVEVRQPSAKGDSLFAVSTQKISLTTVSPTSSGSANVRPSEQALRLSQFPAQLKVEWQATLNNVNLSTLNPTISGSVVVSLGVHKLDVALFKPTIKASGAVTYPADRNIIAITAQSPTVVGSAVVGVEKQALTIAVARPEIRLAVQPYHQLVNLSVLNPSVTGTAIYSVGRETVSLVQLGVEVITSVTYTAGLQKLNVGQGAPMVTSGAVVSLVKQLLVVAPVSPSVRLEIQTSTRNVTITALSPIVSGGSQFAANTQFLNAQTFRPIVSGSGTITYPADRQTVALALLQPTVIGSVNVKLETQIVAVTSKGPTLVSIFVPASRAIMVESLTPTVAGGATTLVSKSAIGLVSLSPTVVASNNLPVSLQHVSLVQSTPTITGSAHIESVENRVNITAISPKLLTSSSVYVDKQSFNVSALDATVSASGTIRYPATAQSLLVATKSPTVAIGKIVVMPVQRITANTIEPEIIISATPTPDTVGIGIITGKPITPQNGGYDLDPSLRLGVIPLDVSVVTDTRITVGVLTLALSSPRPIIGRGATIATETQVVAILQKQPTASTQVRVSTSTHQIQIRQYSPLVSTSTTVSVGLLRLSLNQKLALVSIRRDVYADLQRLIVSNYSSVVMGSAKVVVGTEYITLSQHNPSISTSVVARQSVQVISIRQFEAKPVIRSDVFPQSQAINVRLLSSVVLASWSVAVPPVKVHFRVLNPTISTSVTVLPSTQTISLAPLRPAMKVVFVPIVQTLDVVQKTESVSGDAVVRLSVQSLVVSLKQPSRPTTFAADQLDISISAKLPEVQTGVTVKPAPVTLSVRVASPKAEFDNQFGVNTQSLTLNVRPATPVNVVATDPQQISISPEDPVVAVHKSIRVTVQTVLIAPETPRTKTTSTYIEVPDGGGEGTGKSILYVDYTPFIFPSGGGEGSGQVPFVYSFLIQGGAEGAGAAIFDYVPYKYFVVIASDVQGTENPLKQQLYQRFNWAKYLPDDRPGVINPNYTVMQRDVLGGENPRREQLTQRSNWANNLPDSRPGEVINSSYAVLHTDVIEGRESGYEVIAPPLVHSDTRKRQELRRAEIERRLRRLPQE